MEIQKDMITKEQYTEALAIVSQYQEENRIVRPQPDDMVGYAKVACYQLGTTLARIQSPSRDRKLVYKRMILAHLLREKYPLATLKSLGEVINRHHSSVIYQISQANELMQYEDFNQFYNMVEV